MILKVHKCLYIFLACSLGASDLSDRGRGPGAHEGWTQLQQNPSDELASEVLHANINGSY